MALPPLSASGVLPPFVGNAAAPGRSPYLATLDEVAVVFCGSARRRELLRNLIKYRAELRNVGITSGFQWLDGSFIETGREPNDIDVITFSEQQPLPTPQVLDLFVPVKTKAKFSCDGYFVHLAQPNRQALVRRVAYWFGLLSQRRGAADCKGLVQVSLDDAAQDAAALAYVDTVEQQS